VCLTTEDGVLFIDARGPYLAERQLHAVVAVVLNFHAKSELETPQSGAGRPGDPTIWPPTFCGRLGLSSGSWWKRIGSKAHDC